MLTIAQDVRGVLIEVSGANLLLPNATMAEVLSFTEPDRIENTPDWLLGTIRWRGWQVPLISFSRYAGIGEEKGRLGNRILILKTLNNDKRHPYISILTQGFPRLVTVSEKNISVDSHTDVQALKGVSASVVLNDDQALIPDVDELVSTSREILYQ